MTGRLDFGLKYLFSLAPQHFTEFLVPGAQFEGTKSSLLKINDDRYLETDVLYIVRVGGERMLLHVEFQAYSDSNMGRRLLHYNVHASFQYGLPTSSTVLYLTRCKQARSPYREVLPTREEAHRFFFDAKRFCDLSLEEVRALNTPAGLPLLVLARGGARREIIEEIFVGLAKVDNKDVLRGLIDTAYVLAALVFVEPSEKQWLKERFQMQRENYLKASWAYEEVVRAYEILAQVEEIKEEGRAEGREEGLRQAVVSLVAFRFPQYEELAKEATAAAEDLELLHHMLLKVSVARSEEEIHSLLMSLRKPLN